MVMFIALVVRQILVLANAHMMKIISEAKAHAAPPAMIVVHHYVVYLMVFVTFVAHKHNYEKIKGMLARDREGMWRFVG